MKVKYFEFRKGDVLEALGAEITVGGKNRRNAVAFWTAPTTEDLRLAAAELKKWAKREKELWQKNKDEYLKTFD